MTSKRVRRERDDLQTIPGVGPSLAQDLRDLGITQVAELRGQDPERLGRVPPLANEAVRPTRRHSTPYRQPAYSIDFHDHYCFR